MVRGTRIVILGLLALIGAACGNQTGDASVGLAVWDLRDTRSVETVGWPEDMGSMFEAHSDERLERILLAGGVVVEGTFRVSPARRGGIGDEPCLGDLPRWAEANAAGLDLGAGGGSAMSERGRLEPEGPSAQLMPQAFPDGDAVLRLLIVWPADDRDTG